MTIAIKIFRFWSKDSFFSLLLPYFFLFFYDIVSLFSYVLMNAVNLDTKTIKKSIKERKDRTYLRILLNYFSYFSIYIFLYIKLKLIDTFGCCCCTMYIVSYLILLL